MSEIKDVGLVLEGGGFRGMFTAAVLDLFHQHELFFNYAIGVSAGAAYGVSYVSRQFKRNLEVNPYVSDSRYCSFKNLITKGNFFDWDFVYKEMPTKYVPFDYEAFHRSSTKLTVVLTSCTTGEPVYKVMEGTSQDRFRDLLTATSSLPLLSKIKSVDDDIFLDGGIADSIPIHKAFNDGYKRLVVVLTRPADYVKQPLKGKMIMKLVYRKYPHMLNALLTRAERYNKTVKEVEELEKQGKIFVIRPKSALPISRIGNNPPVLQTVYENTAVEVQPEMDRLKSWLGM